MLQHPEAYFLVFRSIVCARLLRLEFKAPVSQPGFKFSGDMCMSWNVGVLIVGEDVCERDPAGGVNKKHIFITVFGSVSVQVFLLDG